MIADCSWDLEIKSVFLFRGKEHEQANRGTALYTQLHSTKLFPMTSCGVRRPLNSGMLPNRNCTVSTASDGPRIKDLSLLRISIRTPVITV
jgi:hypothetical protein